MFTGIVEEIGTLLSCKKGAKSAVLTIAAKKVLDETTQIGDSIALNGVCLTVTSKSQSSYTVDVMNETLNRSNLSALKPGEKVNLERAMAANGRFGGHMVAGHIDGCGVISAVEKDDNAIWYTIDAKPDILRYVIEKGSIAIDGISLTVAYVDDKCFKVSIIPHTQKETILQYKMVGDSVNLENDLVGKYIEKLCMPQKDNAKDSRLNMEFLAENGFL